MVLENQQFVQCFQLSINDLKKIIGEAVEAAIPTNLEDKSNLTKSSNDLEIKTDFLTREQVKNILNVSYPTLWKYNNEGTLKVKRKIGRRVYYSKKDLNNLINDVA